MLITNCCLRPQIMSGQIPSLSSHYILSPNTRLCFIIWQLFAYNPHDIPISPISAGFSWFSWAPHEIQSALQFLFSRGFALEAVDSDQTRPLHLAARFGHSQAVAKLIGPGTSVFGKGDTITLRAPTRNTN